MLRGADFSDQFRKVIMRYERIACLEFKFKFKFIYLKTSNTKV